MYSGLAVASFYPPGWRRSPADGSKPGGRYDPATDTWHPLSSRNHPTDRVGMTAVWTGTEMIVWGGRLGDGSPTASGGRYDPLKNVWKPTSAAGAPSSREGHGAVWTGGEMIVWGGQDRASLISDGARYLPETDTWTPLPAVWAPQARSRHSAVWTGSEMVVWGGCATLPCDAWHFTGGRYVPATDSWTAIGSGAFTPFARYAQTAVWSGSQMLIWGGWRGFSGTETHTGGAYCPGPGSAPVYTPAAPTGLRASGVSMSRIDLSWTDNSSGESGFKIDRCLGNQGECDGNPIQSYAWIGNVGADVTTFSDTTRQAGRSYSYRVRATNAGGDSGYSNTASAMTTDIPPIAPSNLIVVAADDARQVDLFWQDNSANEQGFRIERCTGAASFCDASPASWGLLAQVGIDDSEYSDTTVQPKTTYSYRVRVFNAEGDSAWSNTASVTTSDSPPAAPSNLTATLGAGGSSGKGDPTATLRTFAALAWKDNSSNETAFVVERCEGITCTNFAQVSQIGADLTTWRDSSVARRTTYRYRVKAHNTAGDSAYSNIALATMPSSRTKDSLDLLFPRIYNPPKSNFPCA